MIRLGKRIDENSHSPGVSTHSNPHGSYRGFHNRVPCIFDPPAKSKPKRERLAGKAKSCAHVRLQRERKQALGPVSSTHGEANLNP